MTTLHRFADRLLYVLIGLLLALSYSVSAQILTTRDYVPVRPYAAPQFATSTLTYEQQEQLLYLGDQLDALGQRIDRTNAYLRAIYYKL